MSEACDVGEPGPRRDSQEAGGDAESCGAHLVRSRVGDNFYADGDCTVVVLVQNRTVPGYRLARNRFRILRAVTDRFPPEGVS